MFRNFNLPTKNTKIERGQSRKGVKSFQAVRELHRALKAILYIVQISQHRQYLVYRSIQKMCNIATEKDAV